MAAFWQAYDGTLITARGDVSGWQDGHGLIISERAAGGEAAALAGSATASATATGTLASTAPTVAITSFAASGADLVIEYSYTTAGSSPLLTASLERDGTPIADVTTSSITGTLTITDPGAGVYALTLLDLTDSGGTDTDGPWGSTVTILGAAAVLEGDAEASALASGLLGASEVPLAGAAILSAGATGSLSTAVQLAAQALAGGQAVGDLSTAIQLGGAAVSAVVSAGELTAQIRLDGAALAAALASGALSTGDGLEGAATGSALGAGSLTTLIVLQGAAVGAALAAADLSTVPSGLAGDATAGAAAAGALTTAIPLLGGAQVSVIAAGTVATTVSLAGAAVAVVAVSGDLVVALELSADAVAAAVAGADLTTQVVMRADAVAGAQASGALTTQVVAVVASDSPISIRARRSAARAVARNGKSIAYIRIEEGAYDATAGAPVAQETRYLGKCVLVSAGGEGARDTSDEFVAGLAVGAYQVALLAASDWPFDPAPGDRIEIDQKEAIVRAARPTWAGEQVALWRVILER